MNFDSVSTVTSHWVVQVYSQQHVVCDVWQQLQETSSARAWNFLFLDGCCLVLVADWFDLMPPLKSCCCRILAHPSKTCLTAPLQKTPKKMILMERNSCKILTFRLVILWCSTPFQLFWSLAKLQLEILGGDGRQCDERIRDNDISMVASSLKVFDPARF